MSIESVGCLLATGKRVQVVPEESSAHFAIHLRIVDGKVRGPGWTITHRPTGYAVWTARKLSEAKAVLEWLEQSRRLPNDPEEVAQWRQTVGIDEVVRIRADLRMIAPLWEGPDTVAYDA